MTRAQVALLPDGRLHLNDGPIDLIIGADGSDDAVKRAYRAAARRFETVLDELCAELPLLRRTVDERPAGKIARRMWRATSPLSVHAFITPMAAVAGAIAEEILEAMVDAARLSRAYVNNGGDIALHLTADASYRIGLIDRPDAPSLQGHASVGADRRVRGVATSGWRGRSFSLGIADAVTVLARTASEADAAATLIANAVDLPGHPAIIRAPADSLQPDSDLGSRLVTRAVGPLAPSEIAEALDRGLAFTSRLKTEGSIIACALRLAGETRALDLPTPAIPALEAAA